MVTITNGVNTIKVSNGAYNGMFRKQGYRLVEQDAVGTTGQAEAESRANTGGNTDDVFLEEVREKPISQWSKAEVKRYASITGLDISGTKNIGEARELIKAHMEAEEKSEAEE